MTSFYLYLALCCCCISIHGVTAWERHCFTTDAYVCIFDVRIVIPHEFIDEIFMDSCIDSINNTAVDILEVSYGSQWTSARAGGDIEEFTDMILGELFMLSAESMLNKCTFASAIEVTKMATYDCLFSNDGECIVDVQVVVIRALGNKKLTDSEMYRIRSDTINIVNKFSGLGIKQVLEEGVFTDSHGTALDKLFTESLKSMLEERCFGSSAVVDVVKNMYEFSGPFLEGVAAEVGRVMTSC
jgi:hypothetical protein